MASIDIYTPKYQVQKQLDEGLLNHLDLLKFIVATVDNIDFLQRHSMVYCGDQGRSWHGTSVQVMQPNNMTKVLDAGEKSSAQHSSLVVSADTQLMQVLVLQLLQVSILQLFQVVFFQALMQVVFL